MQIDSVNDWRRTRLQQGNTNTVSYMSYRTYVSPCKTINFLPELPFLLPLNHTLMTRNTNTSLPFLTFKVHRRKLEEFWMRQEWGLPWNRFKPLLKFCSLLKIPIPQTCEEKSCIVYQVPCSDCEFVYIGQTKRDLKSRLAEHKRAIKFQRPEQSALVNMYAVWPYDWLE